MICSGGIFQLELGGPIVFRTPKRAAVVTPHATIDYAGAKAWAARVTENNRAAFACAFTEAVMRSCWIARGIKNPLRPFAKPNQIQLSNEALIEAEKFGASLIELSIENIVPTIGGIYTACLPDHYRATHGIFYTPPELVQCLIGMAEDGGIDWRAARVLDPACGGGAFLVPVAIRMIQGLGDTNRSFVVRQLQHRIRGFESDPFGAWLAQRMLELALRDIGYANELPEFIENRDSLDLRSVDEAKYDLVIGNPPYGKVSLSLGRRAIFRRSVHGHANLYGVFTDAALRWSKPGGLIAYVTPTSMLSGLYFKALRSLLASEAPPLSVNFVSERSGIFADVLQETMLATYRRKGNPHGGRVGFIEFNEKGRAVVRKTGTVSLPAHGSAPWILPRSTKQSALTRRLAFMPYRLRHYGYSVSTGPLVWNRFRPQFREQQTKNTHPVIWAESVTPDGRFVWRSEKRNHVPWFAVSRPKDGWLIVDRACILVQRTTAKEQSRRLIAAELPSRFIRQHNGVLVENHLNMVRPSETNPAVPAAVIAALLNSKAVDAAFRCINGSVAVSAFELEELPLPSPTVLEKVRRLLASNAAQDKIETAIAAAYYQGHHAAGSA
ncbi:MAG: N-6 DNA methylase [Alphaproteobacteria bacterium]|nr:N-6 DNA methylase [Alphaproteobacteria bacterium]